MPRFCQFSFNSTIHRVQSPIVSYFGFRFTAGYKIVEAARHKQTSSFVFRHQQTPPNVTKLPRSGGTALNTSDGRSVHNKRWSEMLVEKAIFSYPTCIRRPVTRCHDVSYTEKLEWCGYTWWLKKCANMFIRFNRIHERDSHTDGRTDRQTDPARRHRSRLCIASFGNKLNLYSDV